MAAMFDSRVAAEAARHELEALRDRWDVEVRPAQAGDRTPTTAPHPVIVRGVSAPAVAAVRAVVARHHGSIVIDIKQEDLRRP